MRWISVGLIILGLGMGLLLSRLVSPDRPPVVIEWQDVSRQMLPLPDMTTSSAWRVIAVGYTACPDVCPTTLSQLANVIRRMPTHGLIEFMFVTVDGSDASQYVKAFHPMLRGMTGEPAEIQVFMDSLGMLYRVSEQGPPAHSADLVLVDPTGRLRGRVRPGYEPEQLASELARLL